MGIGVVGVSQSTAALSERERFSFMPSEKLEALTALFENINEVVLLATCGRTEIYFADDAPDAALRRVRRYLADWYRRRGGDPEKADALLFAATGTEAVAHLFLVAGGMDSAVLGEDQILGQVKDALHMSIDLKFSGKILNRLFMNAITTGKMIRSELKISELPLSTSYIGIQLLRKKLGDFHDKSVFVIGAGEIGRLALQYLHEEQPRHLYLANRTRCKANALQGTYPEIEGVPYADRYETLATCDALITATASPHTVIQKAHFHRDAQAGPLVIVDLGMPKDVDPAVASHGVELYNLDDLRAESEANQQKREALARQATFVCQGAVKEFEEWLAGTAGDDSIRRIETRICEIQKDAMNFLDRKVALQGRTRRMVDKMFSYALHRLTKEAVLQMKQKGADPAYRALVESLFVSEED